MIGRSSSGGIYRQIGEILELTAWGDKMILAALMMSIVFASGSIFQHVLNPVFFEDRHPAFHRISCQFF